MRKHVDQLAERIAHMNRRTPHGSSAGPYSTGIPAASTRASASSTSSTSIDRSGVGVPDPPSDAKLICVHLLGIAVGRDPAVVHQQVEAEDPLVEALGVVD